MVWKKDSKEHLVKPLAYQALDGFSQKQLSEHHDVLYAGYVKKLNEIESKLKAADRAEANATFSLVGELKRQEGFATNAIQLHEGYFDNMGAKQECTGAIRDLLVEEFGSVEKWAEDFKASALAARGWVVLAYNWEDGRLHTYSTDYHTQGVWNCSTLLILDVYEHAYFIDYATARKKYVEAFMNAINWNFVNERLKQLGVLQHRQKH